MTFGRVAEALPRAIRLVGWPKLVIFFFFFIATLSPSSVPNGVVDALRSLRQPCLTAYCITYHDAIPLSSRLFIKLCNLVYPWENPTYHRNGVWW